MKKSKNLEFFILCASSKLRRSFSKIPNNYSKSGFYGLFPLKIVT